MIFKFSQTLGLALLMGIGLSSCTYQGVMDERRQENAQLQRAYQSELDRTDELKRKTPR